MSNHINKESELEGAAVELHHLVIGYTTHEGMGRVAGPLNATLHPGTLTVLLGPNGAGKSTLLRTISKFQNPLMGRVLVQGRSLDDYSQLEFSKTLSVVLTEKPDLQNMTVRELVGMGRSPYTGFWGRLSLEDRRLVEESISLMGIEDLADRMGQTLSDGERQKCMIAKALAQSTPVILLDEPSAFLDYPSKVEVMQKLHELAHRYHKTVFLSTHDMELALQIADRVWLLDKKHGLVCGTPEDVILSGDLERFFHRDGIRFEPRTGQFLIENVCTRKVRLTGDEEVCGLMRRALYRNGVETVPADSFSAEMSIECHPQRFLVAGSGKVCASVEEVLQQVL